MPSAAVEVILSWLMASSVSMPSRTWVRASWGPVVVTVKVTVSGPRVAV